jgi:hypothetical protein
MSILRWEMERNHPPPVCLVLLNRSASRRRPSPGAVSGTQLPRRTPRHSPCPAAPTAGRRPPPASPPASSRRIRREARRDAALISNHLEDRDAAAFVQCSGDLLEQADIRVAIEMMEEVPQPLVTPMQSPSTPTAPDLGVLNGETSCARTRTPERNRLAPLVHPYATHRCRRSRISVVRAAQPPAREAVSQRRSVEHPVRDIGLDPRDGLRAESARSGKHLLLHHAPNG